MIVKPEAYLISSAQARALFATLFEACQIALPINISGEHNVECHYSARDLGEKLPGRSVSVILNELRWLANNSWLINKNGNVRYLGRRIDGVFYLLADVAAKQLTDEERLVSRRVLGLTLPGAPVTPEMTKRGAGRKWRGDAKATGGGRLDLGPRA